MMMRDDSKCLVLYILYLVIFQHEAIGEFYAREHKAEQEELQDNSEVEQMWYAPAPVSLADVGWLAHEKGDMDIILKTQPHHHRRHGHKRERRRVVSSLSSSDHRPVTTSTPVPGGGQCSCQPSLESGYNTPSSSGSSSELSTGRNSPITAGSAGAAASNPDAMEQISAMQNELLALRQQIAVLVLAQEQTAKQMGKLNS
jgi:hypothetical protein